MINLAPERTRSNFVPLVDDKVILDVVETPVFSIGRSLYRYSRVTIKIPGIRLTMSGCGVSPVYGSMEGGHKSQRIYGNNK